MMQFNSSSHSKVWKYFFLAGLLVTPTLVCLVWFHAGTKWLVETVHFDYHPVSKQTNWRMTDPTWLDPAAAQGLPNNNNMPLSVDMAFNSNDNDQKTNKMECRITKQMSIVEGSMSMAEEAPLLCVSIVDGKEKDDFVLDEYLSHEFYHRHQAALSSHDDMFVSMTGVAVQGKTRTLTGNDNTVINVVETPAEHVRRMAEGSKGTYTFAIVRVTTLDSQLTLSKQELEEYVLNDGEDAVNVITQYRAMSFGQFQLQPVGVFDVFINQNITDFPSASDMYETINEAAIQQFGVDHMSDLANKVNICYPPTHHFVKEFIANTYQFSWRASYNNDWCASLSATIHEMGHQIGLLHSHIVYNDKSDMTSYMSFGWVDRTYPRQTFNGANNLMLGWFEKRTLYLDPLDSKAQLVELAPIVDFKKTKVHQPVLLVIGEKYVLQYNRAKGFNNETRQLKNWVTITVNENFGTERKGAISLSEPLFTMANYSGSGRDLMIQACADVPGNGKRRPDLMVISVGLGKTVCNLPTDDDDGVAQDDSSKSTVIDDSSSSPKAAPSPRQSKSPTTKKPRPSKSPKAAPSPQPSKAPTTKKARPPTTTKAPTTATPSLSPKAAPMKSPTIKTRRPSKSPTIKVPTTATPSQSPDGGKWSNLRPSHSPNASPITSSPSFSPSTSSPSDSPVISSIPTPSPSASPTGAVPGSSPTRPFTNSTTPVSVSFMYIISLLLVAIGAWQVFVFVY